MQVYSICSFETSSDWMEIANLRQLRSLTLCSHALTLGQFDEPLLALLSSDNSGWS